MCYPDNQLHARPPLPSKRTGCEGNGRERIDADYVFPDVRRDKKMPGGCAQLQPPGIEFTLRRACAPKALTER